MIQYVLIYLRRLILTATGKSQKSRQENISQDQTKRNAAPLDEIECRFNVINTLNLEIILSICLPTKNKFLHKKFVKKKPS
jgi:hypothetical protein